MATIFLDDIAGIASGVTLTGTTTISAEYAVGFVPEHIISYYKRDGSVNFTPVYYVFIVLANYTQKIPFLSASDRDTFYTSLP